MEIIKLTDKAQEQAKIFLMEEEAPKEGLRVAAGGGCSGINYQIGWDDSKEGDIIHQYDNGLTVMVDADSSAMLEGASLEFNDDSEEAGFKIIHPDPPEPDCGGCKCD